MSKIDGVLIGEASDSLRLIVEDLLVVAKSLFPDLYARWREKESISVEEAVILSSDVRRGLLERFSAGYSLPAKVVRQVLKARADEPRAEQVYIDGDDGSAYVAILVTRPDDCWGDLAIGFQYLPPEENTIHTQIREALAQEQVRKSREFLHDDDEEVE